LRAIGAANCLLTPEASMETTPRVRDETVTLNGLRFHYRDWDNPGAPPVILLHGYTSHARSWDTIAQGLADRFRVLALDQRGHGESDWATDYHEQRLVEDLAALVDALGLNQVALVGMSIGGSTACSYAARVPERVSKLVAMECVTDPDVDASDPRLVEHLTTLRTLPAAYDTAEEAAVAYRPLAPYATDDELTRWMRNGLKSGPGSQLSWRVDPSLRKPGPPGRLVAEPEEFAHRLGQVTCPILMLVGEDSFALPSSVRFAQRLPQVQLVRIPASGHWIPLDNPQDLLQVVGAFLDGRSQPATTA
jgi:pimeloyl-ACP methyl ester carboxylesterase